MIQGSMEWEGGQDWENSHLDCQSTRPGRVRGPPAQRPLDREILITKNFRYLLSTVEKATGNTRNLEAEVEDKVKQGQSMLASVIGDYFNVGVTRRTLASHSGHLEPKSRTRVRNRGVIVPGWSDNITMRFETST